MGTNNSWPGNNWVSTEAKLLALAVSGGLVPNRSDIFCRSKKSGSWAKYAAYVEHEVDDFEQEKSAPLVCGD